jgi:uncharacterized protein YfdQ (DUF2303 family)
MSTEAEAIADLAVLAEGSQILTGEDGRQWLVQPGREPKDITHPEHAIATLPIRVVQQVSLQTADSLSDYMNRFKADGSALFADIDKNVIVGRVDYHDHINNRPQHLLHTATLHLPFSQEWALWTGIDGKMMGQLELARFLEENLGDISSPAGADVLEACRDLQALRKVTFNKAVRTDSDNETFSYSDETNLVGKVAVPTAFMLRIPVYFGGATVSLQARLRWRLDDGRLYLGIALQRAESVRQAEFKMVVADVEAKTALTAFMGAANPCRFMAVG